jgi:hypothetical protein
VRPTDVLCTVTAFTALTLADAHGLVVINERRISTCWSTDRHLALTGANLVVSTAGI